MSEVDLQLLFKACDKKGLGRIGPDEFRELCVGFDINPGDSDSIFADLDHDNDGQVTLDDFAWGFREFAARGGSRPTDEECERRREGAALAWCRLVDHTAQKLLVQSGHKLAELYEDLHMLSSSPELVTRFESVLASLLQDFHKLHSDNKAMKDVLKREREKHVAYLRSLEDEMDTQVMRAVENARREAELERQALIENTQLEISELRARFKLFEKLNALADHNGTKHKTEDNNCELRNNLAGTKTDLALVQTEMAQLRSDYEQRCRELNCQQERIAAYLFRHDDVHQQLNLLQVANSQLRETNNIFVRRKSLGMETFHRTGLHTITRMSERNTGGLSDPTQFIDSGPQSLEVPMKVQRLMEDWDGEHYTSLQEELMEVSEWDLKTFQSDELDSGIGLSPGMGGCSLESTDCAYKIIFAGDAAVGKSSFIHRFCKETFEQSLRSTLGVDFHVKTVQIDNRKITLQLWDTAGQERFRAMTKTYFRRADGVMLLYDITNERSFLSVRQWVQSIEEVSEKRIPIVLCGNKLDLREDSKKQGLRCVTSLEGEKLAQENDAIFLESSSKNGVNIVDAVVALARAILAVGNVAERSSVLHIGQNQESPKKVQSSCCR